MFAMPPVTQALIIINVLVYLLQTVAGNQLVIAFGLWPLSTGMEGQFDVATRGASSSGSSSPTVSCTAASRICSSTCWRCSCSARRSSGCGGAAAISVYYLACVVSAALAQLIVASAGWRHRIPRVGASGGVFGLLLAFGMMFPRRMVMLLFPPIPMPAWLLVTLYGALELFMGITGTQQGVAHFAHLGGMAGGFLLIQYWRGRLPIRPGRR